MPNTAIHPAQPAASAFVQPFAFNGDLLLQRHARQCARPGNWKAAADDALYAVHGFFAPRFATSVLAGTALVLVAMALI
jgi:hypothetical protein